jgi:hypothetical protein
MCEPACGPALIKRNVCLSSLSKNLEGELRLLEAEHQECPKLQCRTLETVHQLELNVSRHDCDSTVGAQFDGLLRVCELVHKFQDGNGDLRGVHEGCFTWKGGGLRATGILRGVTNVGTHRSPAFDDCQRCDQRGVMEGLLVGTIDRARDPRLVGCELRAAYRLRFESSPEGGSSGVAGTLEGSVICDCPKDAPGP